MMEKLGGHIANHPFAAISIVLLITIASAASVAHFGLQQEFSEDTFMPDLAIVRANSEIAANFTSTYDISILVKSPDDDLLTRDALVEMLEMEQAIADSSIKNELFTPATPAYSIGSVADIISQFVLQQRGVENPTYDEKIAALQGMNDSDIKNTIKVMLSPFFPYPQIKTMLSMSLTKEFNESNIRAKGSIIRVSMNYSLRKNGERALQVEQTLNTLIKGYAPSSVETYVMGEQIITDEIMKANNESMGILFPLAFAMVIVILVLIYRDVVDVIVSLLALIFAIIWMYGFGAAMGYSFNPMTTAIPVLLVGLGIDYGIHLTMRYREERQREDNKRAVEKTVKYVGMSLLLATITTVIAFLSNLSSPIDVLATFGILAAVGICASFATMILFVPASQYLRNRRKDTGEIQRKRERALTRGMAKVAVSLERHGRVVIGAAVVSSIIMGYYASQLSTTFEIEEFLPEKLDITENLRFMMNEFAIAGGTAEVVYVLVKGDMSSPGMLLSMSRCVDNMKDDAYVVKAGDAADATSILSVMADYADYGGFNDVRYNATFSAMYHEYFENGVPRENITEESITALYDWLFIYAPNDVTMVLHRGERYDSGVIRISVNTGEDENAVDVLYRELKEDSEPLGDHAVVTGGPILTKIVMDLINESQIRSLIITLLACLVVLSLIFYVKNHSYVLGALTLIPVALCVVWILGSMYLLGIPLNVMTLSIASLTVGLGVTYGIHITHRFSEEMVDKDVDEACRFTILHTGSALFGAAATTIAGFGLLVFALMPPLQQFGGITALTILYSFIAATFILPSVLSIWAKRKKKTISRK